MLNKYKTIKYTTNISLPCHRKSGFKIRYYLLYLPKFLYKIFNFLIKKEKGNIYFFIKIKYQL